MWEEIHGFQSPGEFNRFVYSIENQVGSDEAEEIEPDHNYGSCHAPWRLLT